jgi:hypothetical protein
MDHTGCHQLVFWLTLPGVRLVTCTIPAAINWCVDCQHGPCDQKNNVNQNNLESPNPTQQVATELLVGVVVHLRPRLLAPLPRRSGTG